MKIHKLILIAAIALSSLVGLARTGNAAEGDTQGQRQRRGQQTAADRMKRLTEDLKLNEKQAKELETIFAEQMKEMRALRQDSNLSQEQRREQYTKLRAKYEPKIKKVLTTEQWDKYQKMRTERRRGGGQRPQN